MKKIRLIISIAAVALTALVVYSCFDFKNVSIPKVTANSEFTVNMDCLAYPKESDLNVYMIAAFCVPKEWDAANTASIVCSTSGYVPAMVQKSPGSVSEEIVNEKMVPVEESMLEYTTGLPYAQAFKQVYGTGGNFGDVEWVVFRTENKHYITDLTGQAIPDFEINVKATFKTTDVNYKFFFVSWLGEDKDGMGNTWEASREAAESKDNEGCTRPYTATIEMEGGSAKQDYTMPAMVSTVPTEFRFGDFFSVNLVTNLTGAESQLDGKSRVYLCGKAVLTDGTEVTVEGPLPENLMTQNSASSYSKYILPSLFFKTPYDKKIEKMYVWFCDVSGNIVERCFEEVGWELYQASNE